MGGDSVGNLPRHTKSTDFGSCAILSLGEVTSTASGVCIFGGPEGGFGRVRRAVSR
jgi:hypothetical protein